MDLALYLKRIREDSPTPSDKELRNRVESHVVPHYALESEGTPKRRYKNFMKQRAKLVATEIVKRVEH